MDHVVQWYSPAPFWSNWSSNGSRDRMQQPAVLEFRQDNFMKALTTTLNKPSTSLLSKTADQDEDDEQPELSLYQPVHERYYLVTASLVCRERGLPDRAVNTENEESTAFVLRRLERADSEASTKLLAETEDVKTVEVDGKDYVEYAWVKNETNDDNEDAASGDGNTKAEEKTRKWRPLKDPEEQVPGTEERLSMFPKNYEPDRPAAMKSGTRRLWAGLIPVAKRDTYETAPVRRAPVSRDPDADDENESKEAASPSLPAGDALSDSRMTKFDTQVLGAFRLLREQLGNKDNSEVQASKVRDMLVFAWYDFWKFLGTHLPDVQEKLDPKGSPEDATFDDDTPETARKKKDLLRVLRGIDVEEMGLGKWASDALRTFAESEEDGKSDEAGNESEEARNVKSGNLEDVLKAGALPSIDGDLARKELEKSLDRLFKTEVDGVKGRILDPETSKREPVLKTAVNRALGSLEGTQELPDDLQPPVTEPVGEGTYVVRCLYERGKCPEPRRTQLSEPSRPFHLASFFDAQAPSRDINITLPGASLKDLRDSDQSVSMVFTKELRRQAERLQDMTLESLQDGDVGEASTPNLGMVCSLSIPIITICALALLLVMVTLLNIVFWWLPFFKICFPLPSGE